MTIDHLYEKIHEPIDVRIKTDHGKIFIEEFSWRGKNYIVRENCLTNKAARGRTPVWLFSVATDYGSYQLRLDTDRMSWVLEEVMSESEALGSKF